MAVKKGFMIFIIAFLFLLVASVGLADELCDHRSGYVANLQSSTPTYGWKVWDINNKAGLETICDTPALFGTTYCTTDDVRAYVQNYNYNSQAEGYLPLSRLYLENTGPMGALIGTYIYVDESGYYYPYFMTQPGFQGSFAYASMPLDGNPEGLISRQYINLYEVSSDYPGPLKVNFQEPTISDYSSELLERKIGLGCGWYQYTDQCFEKNTLIPFKEYCPNERDLFGRFWGGGSCSQASRVYLDAGVYYLLGFFYFQDDDGSPNGYRSTWNVGFVDQSHNTCRWDWWCDSGSWSLITYTDCADPIEEYPADVFGFSKDTNLFSGTNPHAQGYVGVPRLLDSNEKLASFGFQGDDNAGFCDVTGGAWDTRGSGKCCGDDAPTSSCVPSSGAQTTVDEICMDYQSADATGCTSSAPFYCETECWYGSCYCFGDADIACAEASTCPSYCRVPYEDVGRVSGDLVCTKCSADVDYVSPLKLRYDMPVRGYPAGEFEWVFPETYGTNHCNGVDDDCDGYIDAADSEVGCCSDDDCGLGRCDFDTHMCSTSCEFGTDCTGGFCIEGVCLANCATGESGDACVPHASAASFTEYGMCVYNYMDEPSCNTFGAAKVRGQHAYYDNCVDINVQPNIMAESCDLGTLAGGRAHGGYTSTGVCIKDGTNRCVRAFTCYPDVDGDGLGGDYMAVIGSTTDCDAYGCFWEREMIEEQFIDYYESSVLGVYVPENAHAASILSAGSVCSDIVANGIRFSDSNLDCDDTDASVLGASPEVCDALDNDCDGFIDEGCDDDGDGYADADMTCVNRFTPDGDPANSLSCATRAGDCEDGYCSGDFGCSAFVGRGECEAGCGLYAVQTDCDAYGCEELIKSLCDAPLNCYFSSVVSYADAYPASVVNPGAEEICDTLDNDCDGLQYPRPTLCRDVDRDGHGDIEEVTSSYCSPQQASTALGGSWTVLSACDDCDDSDPSVGSCV